MIGTGGNGAYGMHLGSDGAIFLAGGAIVDEGYQFAHARYTANGTLDLSYDKDGVVTTDLGSPASAADVAADAEGRLLVGGGVDGAMALARYNSDGTLDNSFGTSGVSVNWIDVVSVYPTCMAVQPDQKILLAGFYFAVGSPAGAVVVRLLSGIFLGVLDLSPNGSALLLYPTPLVMKRCWSMTLWSPKRSTALYLTRTAGW